MPRTTRSTSASDTSLAPSAGQGKKINTDQPSNHAHTPSNTGSKLVTASSQARATCGCNLTPSRKAGLQAFTPGHVRLIQFRIASRVVRRERLDTMRSTTCVAIIALIAPDISAHPLSLADETAKRRTIEVTGTAEVSAPPDLAIISLAVETTAQEANRAVEQNAARTREGRRRDQAEARREGSHQHHALCARAALPAGRARQHRRPQDRRLRRLQ